MCLLRVGTNLAAPSSKTSLLLRDSRYFSFQLDLDPRQQNSHASQVTLSTGVSETEFCCVVVGGGVSVAMVVEVVRLNIWANTLSLPLKPMQKFAFVYVFI